MRIKYVETRWTDQQQIHIKFTNKGGCAPPTSRCRDFSNVKRLFSLKEAIVDTKCKTKKLPCKDTIHQPYHSEVKISIK